MNLPEKIYLWLRDLVSKPGERGLSSAGYWQDLLRRKVLGRLAKAEGGLLEIGCGEGLFLSQLSEFNPQLRLFGVERESAVLSDAQRRLKGNVRLVSSDARQLPFKDASFEWAVGVNLFLCVESREALTGILREAARVLRQGARLIVEFRNKDNIFLRLKYKWARYYDSTTKNHPLSTFHKEDVLKILREAGFNVIKTQEIDFPFKGLPAIFILEAVKKGTGYFSSDVEVRNKSSLSPFLPIIGHPIGWDDLAYGLGHSLDRKAEDLFRQSLAGYLGLRHIYFLNSGLSAFYVILEALKKLSPGRGDFAGLYRPNLILAIRKAGLKPVLCDISLGDFNSDTEDVLRKITSDTLCVLGVHMFGIPWQDITRLKEKSRG